MHSKQVLERRNERGEKRRSGEKHPKKKRDKKGTKKVKVNSCSTLKMSSSSHSHDSCRTKCGKCRAIFDQSTF